MEQAELIRGVVFRVCPLEAETLGARAVDQIILGRKFQEVEGGSHINLMDTISIVSCVATVVQMGLAVWPKSLGHARAMLPADFDERFHALVLEHASTHPELQNVLNADSQLLEQVTKALRDLLTT